MLVSIAEISTAAGFYPEVTSTMTERDVELLRERQLLEHNLARHSSRRVGVWDGPWHFQLFDAALAEDFFADTKRLDNFTKMGLARTLQRRDGLTEAQRSQLWSSLTKQELLAAVAVDGPAPPPAKGKGRGKAKGDDGLAPPPAKGKGRGAAKGDVPEPARGRGRGEGRASGRG